MKTSNVLLCMTNSPKLKILNNMKEKISKVSHLRNSKCLVYLLNK